MLSDEDNVKDEEKYFEDLLEKRFGMSSNEAMKRLFVVLMLVTAGTLIWVLTAVELLLVLTFNDSHSDLAWYLAIQSTVGSFLSFFFYNIYGAVSDRVGRKPFILITCFGAGVTALMWGLFEGNTLLVFAIIAALVSVVTSSFPIITLGYFKDCVPHQAFNRVRVDEPKSKSRTSPATKTTTTHNNSEKKNSYTAITQQKWLVVWFGIGTGLGLLCQQGIMIIFKEDTNLKVCMLCSGSLYIIGGIYAIYYLPETVNPDVRVASSLSEYFSKGLWRQDCQFVGNLRKVLKQSASLRVYALWFVLEQCGQSFHTLVLAQYLLYRFGMGSAFLGSMGVISFMSGIISLIFAEYVIEFFGQLVLTLIPVIVGDGLGLSLGLVGSLMYSANNKGIVVLLYPCVMLLIIPGVIVNASFQQRLAGYEMQSTTRGALQGLGQLVDFFCRIPAMLLFQYAMDTSDTSDLTRDSDCDKDGFKDNRTDAWLAENCPDVPPLTESQGDLFDPIALNFMISGIFHILAFLTWCVLLYKYNPLLASQERSKLEIEKWRNKNVDGDVTENGCVSSSASDGDSSNSNKSSIEMSHVSSSSTSK